MTDVYPERRYTIADFEGLPVLQIPAPTTKPARTATTLPLPTPQTGSDTWTATALRAAGQPINDGVVYVEEVMDQVKQVAKAQAAAGL